MLERWKKQLFSEDGMKVVNVLFILLYLVRNPLFTICAYTVWFVYLVYSVRNTNFIAITLPILKSVETASL